MTDNNKEVIDMRETSTDNYVPEDQTTDNAENQQDKQQKVSLKDKAKAKYKEIGPKKILLGAIVIVGTAYFGPKVVKAVKTAITTPKTVPAAANLATAPELHQIPENLNDLADTTVQLCEIGATTADAAAVTEQAQQVQAVANAAETIGGMTVDTVTTF
jgi:hypothetical protein